MCEGAVRYPADLHLEQVQIFFRHDERVPTSARFQNAGLPVDWPYCDAVRRLKTIVLENSGWNDVAWRRDLETAGHRDSPAMKGPSSCLANELTDEGRETTLSLGARLRNLYIGRLGFLPYYYDNNDRTQVRLRSTPRERNLECVQQVFAGLYPAAYRSVRPPTIVLRAMQEETLTPTEAACKCLAELGAAFAKRAAKRWSTYLEMKQIESRTGKWMPEGQPVRVDSHPRLSGITDHINASAAHGPLTLLPDPFYNSETRRNIDRIVTE